GCKAIRKAKKDKERLTVVVCYNEDGSDKVPLWVIAVKIYYWRRFYSSILEGYEKGEKNPEKINDDMPLEQEIGDVEGIHKLKEVISDLHYRNAMDVMQILNYPSENKSLIEPPTDEEIIQRAMDVSADDELWIP
ncbi:hypothetical protein Goklo_007692, partial [Gossypium klotzschianum]|nr:hypothetical protein [Gossypium klotzschianum]